MKTRQNYDRKTLRQYDWHQLYRLQSRLANRKMTPVSFVNALIAIINILIKDCGCGAKLFFVIFQLVTMAWLLVLIIRYLRIEDIMDEK